MHMTKKIELMCNRCGKVVAEVHGTDGFPYDFQKIRTVERHFIEDWFLEILCLECISEQKSDMKRCPVCGSENVYAGQVRHSGDCYAECCDCCNGIGYWKTIEEAIKSWNKWDGEEDGDEHG